jgi:hypothetical protein
MSTALAVFLIVVWLLLATLFLLQARRLELDPSKAPDGTPPARWRLLGLGMIGLAAVNLVALLLS